MAQIVTLTMNPVLDIATATDRVVPTQKIALRGAALRSGVGGINVAQHPLRQEGVAHAAVAIAGFTLERLAVEERQSGEQYRFILPGPHRSVRRTTCL